MATGDDCHWESQIFWISGRGPVSGETRKSPHQVVVRLEGIAPAEHLDRCSALVDVGAEDRVVLVEVEVEQAGVDRRLLEEGLCRARRSGSAAGSHRGVNEETHLDVYL